MRLAWAIVGLVLLMTFGCSHFAASKETCVGKFDTSAEAIELVVPHLASAAVCASKHVEDDKAALACVAREMEALKSHAQPVALACGLALVGDVVAVGKK